MTSAISTKQLLFLSFLWYSQGSGKPRFFLPFECSNVLISPLIAPSLSSLLSQSSPHGVFPRQSLVVLACLKFRTICVVQSKGPRQTDAAEQDGYKKPNFDFCNPLLLLLLLCEGDRGLRLARPICRSLPQGLWISASEHPSDSFVKAPPPCQTCFMIAYMH